jgi:hypothetical protein
MKSCCATIQDLDCSLHHILQRITPIEYENEELIINSGLAVSGFLSLGNNVLITANNGILSLPEGTTVGGTPLLSPHYVDGLYELPVKTMIDGFSILNTNYFYYYTTNNQTFQVFQSGCFINNTISTSTVSSISFVPNYPLLVPRNCILTSLLFSMVVGTGVSTLTNVTATLYLLTPTNTPINTGISVVIATCPVSTQNYNSLSFQYHVPNGYRVGVRITYTGSSTAIYTPFATVGYKFI